MNIGDKVRVLGFLHGVPADNKMLLKLFSGCVGKTFPIVKIDDWLVELHVGKLSASLPNTIRSGSSRANSKSSRPEF